MTQKEEISTRKKVTVVILTILLFGTMATGFFLSRREKTSIKKYGIETNGVITQIYTQNTRGKTCVYKYVVDKVEYTGHQSLGKNTISIGDSCKIIYSSKNHEFSQVIFK